jgi:hypothetical protein
MRTYGEPCILDDRLCTECGECDRCELNSQKTCDNCCQCIDSDADYVGIEIDEILINTEDTKNEHRSVKGFKVKSKG